jgi:hypothetical protein
MLARSFRLVAAKLQLLFFRRLSRFRRFLESCVGGESRIVNFLRGEQFFNAQNLDAWIFVGEAGWFIEARFRRLLSTSAWLETPSQ